MFNSELSVEHPDLPAKLGKYEIRAILGRGDMGIVYRAYDPRIDRIVAMKTIQKNALTPEKKDDALARFIVEARAAGRLMHPNVVSVFEFDDAGDTAFIAMEYIDGVDLRTYIQQHNCKVPLDQVHSILKQLLSALEYAHAQGVVHRDIKPANVFMMRDGTVKLGDFGIAKLSAESTSMTRVGIIVGTPDYMSPERLEGKELDSRSDLFSVGVMLYELLIGEKPFAGEILTVINQILNHHPAPPSTINPILPTGLDAVVRKAMAKETTQRYQTAAEFGKALEAALSTKTRIHQATPEVKLRIPTQTDHPSLCGHSTAAVRVNKGSKLEIPAAGVREPIIRPRNTTDHKHIAHKRNTKTIGDLFSDAPSDALQGALRGGLIGFAIGLLLAVLDLHSITPFAGLGVGAVLGFDKARLLGILLGCLVSFVFLWVSLPKSVMNILLSQFGQFGEPTANVTETTLNLGLQGSIIGSVTLVCCGVYLHLMERVDSR